jgi:tetratricopeptide (TPR) repeat protein
MQPVIEQATHALQLGRFETAKTLASGALVETDLADTRLPLLEVLAQAQAGLQEHDAAAGAWQDAYRQATEPDDKTRLFEQARQAIRDQQDYPMLLQLAQEHLPHSRTPQEQAACMLAAGEALVQLQRYAEARQQYLEPALELAGVNPETRLHLWHYLGLGHLAEHAFAEAAAAFRQSADLALGQHFASSAPHLASQRTQLHHLRNAARFYEGVIHLIYQRPEQAIQSFQELQRPLTTVGALNMALFLGLAYRIMQQPETASRALQPLIRAATSSDTLRGPAAVVRAGIATLQDTPAALGEPFEVAFEAPLQARTAWEPSWSALLYQELGLTFQRLSCREAAVVCYEEGLKAVIQRSGAWPEGETHAALQGANLLATLAALPMETWSAVLQSELGQLLQGLSWLFVQTRAHLQADQVLSLALRVATTPEQAVVIWCQRSWRHLMTAHTQEHDETGLSTSALLEGLQAAQAQCAESPVGRVAEGILALLHGQPDQASALFAQGMQAPSFPELHILCVAAWLWAHTRNNTLTQALASAPDTLPWQTPIVLARALEVSLMLPEQSISGLPWLAGLLTQHPTPTLEALRLLCRPGYLPTSQSTQILAELRHLCTHLTNTTVSDQLVIWLGGTALVERIETLLATLDQHLAAAAGSNASAARQRGKQRQGRGASPAINIAAETAHVLQLLSLWHNTPQALNNSVPALIFGWLRQYTQLSANAPEVVGALLGLFRQCPGATEAIPALLEQLTLSRRQRQAMEAALLTPSEGASTGQAMFAWEDLQSAALGRVFDALADLQRPASPEFDAVLAARGDYLCAMVFTRLPLLSRALASLQSCLQHQPEHPLAHYTLAKLLQGEHQLDAALHHTLQAWHGLQTLAVSPQLLHLEVLNHLMLLLHTTQQQTRLPEWFTAFEATLAAIPTSSLSPELQQRVRAEEGVYALRHATYLAAHSPLAGAGVASTAPQQLRYLEQAIAGGTPETRHSALHRQAELLTRLYRSADAAAMYTDIIQHWPDDHRAQQRLALLTAVHGPTADVASADQLLTDAFALVCADVDALTSLAPLTPESVLAWLPQAPAQAPYMLELVDILTLYGSLAVRRRQWQQALQILSPLYAVRPQPQQAYQLAVAYDARSQHAATGTEALYASDRALQYVEEALHAAPTLQEATVLLQHIQARRQTLMTVQHQEQGRTAYRQRICHLFGQHGVPIHTSTAPGTADAPWVMIQEVADLDDTSGMLVTTVHLAFNGHAMGSEAVPEDAEVILYAQHQRDKQRVVDVHGIEALPWPHTAYEGRTDFALLFPERLGLNRDILFVAFADLHALLRYARVLQAIAHDFVSALEHPATLTDARLAAAARYLTVVPLLHQRLHILAAAAPSKAVQRQINGVCETLQLGMTPETFQHCPAFVDAYTYFHAIGDTMRAHLETPAAERPDVQHPEERQPTRPARRKRRPSKDRWREGEPERRRESYLSDTV